MRVVWLELTIFMRGVSVRVGLVDKVGIDAYVHKTSGKRLFISLYLEIPNAT
jgi:TfoX/Sxy family transcriptional regulator of competence genes